MSSFIFAVYTIKTYSEDKAAHFQRLVGVKRSVFEQMVSAVAEYKEQQHKHKNRGRPPKLSIADQVLVMLMYYREYRTFFHAGSSYELSEGNAIVWLLKLNQY